MTNMEWIKGASHKDICRFMERLLISDWCYSCPLTKECEDNKWGDCYMTVDKWLDEEYTGVIA